MHHCPPGNIYHQYGSSTNNRQLILLSPTHRVTSGCRLWPFLCFSLKEQGGLQRCALSPNFSCKRHKVALLLPLAQPLLCVRDVLFLSRLPSTWAIRTSNLLILLGLSRLSQPTQKFARLKSKQCYARLGLQYYQQCWLIFSTSASGPTAARTLWYSAGRCSRKI